ncbi:hypothetical protein JCM10213_003582 [Rhodosporidiobolus nylandii]
MASLDLSNPALALSFLPTPLSVIQLKTTQPVPRELLAVLAGGEGAEEAAFISLTRTPAETSIILPTEVCERLYPASASEQPLEASGPWVALKVAGPMDLSLTGILHALTAPLKDAVPIFASSTWDTDYVLVKQENKGKAKELLEQAGWTFP